MSCRQHGYPWPSLATSPYHSSPPAGLQGYILCPHIVAVCKFELVVLLLLGHMWGSIGVHHLWASNIYTYIYVRVCGGVDKGATKSSWAEKFIWWRHICCWRLFWRMESKHCNTDERNVWHTRRTILKNKPNLVKFQENILVSLWTF